MKMRFLALLSPILTMFLMPFEVATWSWKPMQQNSYCSSLDRVQFVYHLGDYLLLSLPPILIRKRSLPLEQFYLYNWKSGHLYGQPLRKRDIFGQDGVDGLLLFATTFDICSLKLDVDQRPMRRRKRYLGLDAFGLGGNDELNFEKRKAELMQEMESKLAMLQQDKALTKAVMDLKHQLNDLGNSLLLSQAQQRLVLSSMVMRRPEEQSQPASTTPAATISPERKVHEEMMAKLDALYRNLTQLTGHLNSDQSVKQKQPVVPLPSPAISLRSLDANPPQLPPFTKAPTFLNVLQPQCPTVILTTFSHYQDNWESRLCDDKPKPWFKTVLYKYEASNTGQPTLTSMVLDQMSFSHLLNYRGRVHVGNTSTFVLLRNELACPANPDRVDLSSMLLAGFNIKERMFVQQQKGRVMELVNSRYLNEVSP